MGVGAGLYMCDVVKKVHVRYLISWWVLVLDSKQSGRLRAWIWWNSKVLQVKESNIFLTEYFGFAAQLGHPESSFPWKQVSNAQYATQNIINVLTYYASLKRTLHGNILYCLICPGFVSLRRQNCCV